jgi:hypothetical protein
MGYIPSSANVTCNRKKAKPRRSNERFAMVTASKE